MPELCIGFDPGMSGTKVVYTIDAGQPRLMTMESEIIQLPFESMTHRSNMVGIGVSRAENDSWVTLKKNASVCYAVGYLAKQFRASLQLEKLKFEDGVYKLLAVVGAIIQNEKLPDEIALRLTVLLPYGEFANRKQFRENLKRSLRSFYFRGQLLKVSLLSMVCGPEGGGAAWDLIGRYGESWLAQQEAVVVLMFGHRNTSSLVFSHGVVDSQRSKTTDLGFVRLVDKVIDRTSGQDRDSLSRGLYEIGYDISTNNPILRTLIKSTEERNIQAEVKDLVDAIKLARKEYWVLLKNWLQSAVPSRVDELLICGGAGFYLRPELSEYFAWAEPTWKTADGFESELGKFRDPSMQFRFADICQIFKGSFLERASSVA